MKLFLFAPILAFGMFAYSSYQAMANSVVFERSYTATFNASLIPVGPVYESGVPVSGFDPIKRFGYEAVFPGSPFEVGGVYHVSVRLIETSVGYGFDLTCLLYAQTRTIDICRNAFSTSKHISDFSLDVENPKNWFSLISGNYEGQLAMAVSGAGGHIKTTQIGGFYRISHEGNTWLFDDPNDISYFELTAIPLPASALLLLGSLAAVAGFKKRTFRKRRSKISYSSMEPYP
jgi:hypothetical protein